MTITRQDYWVEYTITSESAERVEFPFAFPVKEASQIHCFDITPGGGPDGRDVVTPIPSRDFSVSPAPNGYDEGGKITLVSPLAVGRILRIERVTPMTQQKVFRNQQSMDPSRVEDALDRLTMEVQETHGALSDLSTDAIETEIDELRNYTVAAIARIDATDAVQNQAISILNTRDMQHDAAISALQAKDVRHDNEIAALQNGKADKSALDAFIAATEVRFQQIWTEMDGLMPAAPTTGRGYLGSGKSWLAWDPAAGEPFVVDGDGYAHTVLRPIYTESAIWNVEGMYVSLRPDAKSGDQDSVFIIDSEGYAVLRSA